MIEWTTLSLFSSVTALLVFIPGPNTLFIVARSVEQGRMAGAISSLGVQVGAMIHIVLAMFGLSALIVSSAVAFNVIKYAGAIYLIYMGIKTLRAKEKIALTDESDYLELRQIFRQGIVVNVLNPKTAVFFFAFLPQFITLGKQSVPIQIFILGSILVLLGFSSDLLYAFSAGSLGQWLRHDRRFVTVQRYFAGVIYIGLGVLTAVSGYRLQ